MDLNRGLTVSGGGVDLALLYGDGGVTVDDTVEYTAEGLDAEGQRRNVEQEEILDVAAEDAALNCRADRNAFVGVDALEGILTDELLDCLLNGRNSGRAADEEDLVDLGAY